MELTVKNSLEDGRRYSELSEEEQNRLAGKLKEQAEQLIGKKIFK